MTDPCILDIVPIDPVEEFFVYRGGGWIVAVVALLVAAGLTHELAYLYVSKIFQEKKQK